MKSIVQTTLRHSLNSLLRHTLQIMLNTHPRPQARLQVHLVSLHVRPDVSTCGAHRGASVQALGVVLSGFASPQTKAISEKMLIPISHHCEAKEVTKKIFLPPFRAGDVRELKPMIKKNDIV